MDRDLLVNFILKHTMSPEATEEIIKDLASVDWHVAFSQFMDKVRPSMRTLSLADNREYKRITRHLVLSLDMGKPATLTYAEWRATLMYFDRQCAYCKSAPYEIFEHYLPLTLGGGTTAVVNILCNN